MFKPEETLKRVYDFCGLGSYGHHWEDIENRCAEAKDEAWGLKNLHAIRPKLGMESANPHAYLPQSAIDYFEQSNVQTYG